jgi:hypothetical protein
MAISDLEKEAIRVRFESLKMTEDGYHSYKAKHLELASTLKHCGFDQDDISKRRVFATGLSDDYVQIKVFLMHNTTITYEGLLAEADAETRALECSQELGQPTPLEVLRGITEVAEGEDKGDHDLEPAAYEECEDADYIHEVDENYQNDSEYESPEETYEVGEYGEEAYSEVGDYEEPEDDVMACIDFVDPCAAGNGNMLPVGDEGLVLLNGEPHILLDGGSNRHVMPVACAEYLTNVRPTDRSIRVASKSLRKASLVGDGSSYICDVLLVDSVLPVLSENKLITAGVTVEKTATQCVLRSPGGDVLATCVKERDLWYVPVRRVLVPDVCTVNTTTHKCVSRSGVLEGTMSTAQGVLPVRGMNINADTKDIGCVVVKRKLPQGGTRHTSESSVPVVCDELYARINTVVRINDEVTDAWTKTLPKREWERYRDKLIVFGATGPRPSAAAMQVVNELGLKWMDE